LGVCRPASEQPIARSHAAQQDTREPPNATLTLDNYGSRYSGAYEATASTQFSPSLVAFDSLQVTAFGSIPMNEAKFGALAYSVPLDAQGTKITLAGQYSRSTPGFTLRPYDIAGDFYKMSLAVMRPILRSRTRNLYLTATFDGVDSKTNSFGVPFYHDSLRVLRVAADYNNADSVGGTNQVSFTFSQGLDLLGATKSGSRDLSRQNGHSNFTKFELNASRLQKLGTDWDIYVAVSGQYTTAPLLVSEEFGFGGQAFGRAYDPSELTGDHGVSGSVELHYNAIPQFANLAIQPFAFFDAGKVWDKASGGASNYGESAGGGIKLSHTSGFGATLGVAYPLRETGKGTASNPRPLFQISYTY
jgi:hemolysin activation/secretion protein